MNARRVLIAAGLTTALLATAASSASATTISPASGDFGRVLFGRTSAPITFTVTLGSGERCRSPGPVGVDCYPIQQDPGGGGFAVGYNTTGLTSSGTCFQVRFLTAATPSCTIIVTLKPDELGPNNGFVFPNYYDGTTVGANVTGIGLLSRKSIYCRSPKKGGIYKKSFSRWCEKRKKK